MNMNIINEFVNEKKHNIDSYVARLERLIQEFTTFVEIQPGSCFDEALELFDEKDQTLLIRLSCGGKL